AARHDRRAAWRAARGALCVDRRHRLLHHSVHAELQPDQAPRPHLDPCRNGDPAQRDRAPRRALLHSPALELAGMFVGSATQPTPPPGGAGAKRGPRRARADHPSRLPRLKRPGSRLRMTDNKRSSMAKLRLTVAAGDYDIVRPLKEGLVEAAGLELIFLTDMGPRERHWRLARKTEFDVCEENVGAYF